MYQHSDQQAVLVLTSVRLLNNNDNTVGAHGCTQFWDAVDASICPKYVPWVAAIPLIIAISITLGHALRLFVGYRPEWTKPFVKEYVVEKYGSLEALHRRSLSLQTVALIILSFFGAVLQTVPIWYAGIHFTEWFLGLTWANALLLVAVLRPIVSSKSLLLIFSALSISQAIVVAQTELSMRTTTVIATIQLVLAFAAVTTILLAPMRDPKLPKEEISPIYGTPTFELRSPEDNLTLLQFLTVAWMSPLISLGKKRQLNDEDVWALSYEFQHRLLHDKFRDLPGSLLGRLIKANGVDLILLGALGIIDLLANLSIPVLLQQLLRAMENVNAPVSAAIVYAVLSLVARLISTQIGVLSLWNGRRAYERSRGEMITMLYEKTLSRKVIGINQDTKESASMGKILNLMRNDAYEIAQRFWEFQSLVTKPIGLVLAIILLWQIIGWPCLFGVLTVIIGQALNALFARSLLIWERKRRAASDTKLQKVSQFVEAIRHLRWYGWQDTWRENILEARQHELNLRIITGLWNVLIAFTNTLASGMFPVAAFYAYTALAGKELRIDIAFPALQVFFILESNLREIPALITVVLNARVSVGRIEEFLSEPDVDTLPDNELSTNNAAELLTEEVPEFNSSKPIELKHASFAWPGSNNLVLRDVSVSFRRGLTVICGEVGAGKTALLEALLGELDQRGGELFHMEEAVGYCAQRPWLQSMSIRDNILFSAPYEEDRYKKVLEVCALNIDMVNFKHGDRSIIGENGVGLSGGQRARVALARAVYSKTKILLLDDPISALDHQTAEFVINRCLAGELIKDRIVVLVTHRTELCHGLAKQIIEVAGGTTHSIDLEKPYFDKVEDDVNNNPAGSTEDEPDSGIVAEKFLEDEFRAHGGVKTAVYWEYIKAGRFRWWSLLVCIMVIYRMTDVLQNWFLKEWGEAYTDSKEELSTRSLFDRLPPPDVNVMPWLIGFALIALGKAVLQLVSQSAMLVIVYTTGRQMFKDVVRSVSHATFRFYDVTPVGRLMNRMTSDINTIDGNISGQFQTAAYLGIAWITSIVVIGSSTPIFLACALALTLGFVLIFLHFLPASQSLRRLEFVSLTPLLSNFGALVEGLTTVRAFRAHHRFLDRVITVTDNFQKMDHFYWSLQSWLSYRFDILSDFSTLVLTLIAIATNTSPGLTAFVLIAAQNLVASTYFICKTYGQLQMDFVSVERIVELLHLEQERPGAISPPAWWPSHSGDIIFKNATVRYAPHLDPSLIDLSFTIKAGSSTAIIGRTGSGKSTLAMALLATVVPESGQILIDNIDISEVDTQALRQRITFVAQDPVLFPGSMRQNLDPLGEYTDEECEAVLVKIAGRHQWTLETEIEAAGRNLSQGQRQLIGLARTLLRRSAIVILDEATASIDKETAQSIQNVLHQEMKGRTVITIAHRLEAVKNAEYCIVLDKGRVLKQGRAADILKDDSENLLELKTTSDE